MNTSKTSALKLFFSLLAIAFTLASCSYEKTVFEIGSLFDPTFDFSKSSEFSFDENFVEVKDGKAQLKPLDLEHAGNDFNGGAHVGSSFNSNESLSLKILPDADDPHVNTILPSLSSSLNGYWRLDNNTNDSSGNSLHGVEMGDVFYSTDSKIGTHARDFDGTGDFISIADSNKLDVELNSGFTISTWYNLTDDDSDAGIFGKWGGSNNSYTCRFDTNADNNLDCFISSDGTSYIQLADILPFSTGWHHLVFYYDGANIGVYHDGVFVSSTPHNTGVFNSNSNFEIGTYNGLPDKDVLGRIDEVAIWKTVLSANNVRDLYHAQALNYIELSPKWTPKWENIVGYWKMDGNWQDSSGNGNFGILSGTVIFSPESKVGSAAISFDGAGDDFIDVPDDDSLDPTEISISAWIKRSTEGVEHPILGKGSTTSYRLEVTDTNKLRFRDRGNANIVVTPEDIEADVWRHVVAVGSASGLKIYIDGKISVQNSTAYGSPNVGSNLILGSFVNLGGRPIFDGLLDDIAIWDKPLSTSEVLQIYNRQKQKYAGHYDSEVMDLGSVTSSWPDLSWSTNLPFGKELVGDFNNDGNSDSESSSDYSSVINTTMQGLLGSWSLNEKATDNVLIGGADFEDLSGNSAHLTEEAGVLINQSGIIGAGIRLDGIDDNLIFDISTSLNTNFLDDFTISGWFKIPTAQNDLIGSNNRLWIRYFNTGLDSLNIRNSGSVEEGKIDFRRGDGSSTVVALSNRRINDGEFHHIVALKQGSIMKLYIDGVIEAQETDNSVLNEQINNFRLGRNTSGGAAFSGNIDEVAIWSRGLADVEIQQLYRRGANRVKLQVKSCVDSHCECKSFNASPAGSATDCDGDTIVNSLDFDDPYKAEFIGPGGDGSTYYSEAFNRRVTDLSFDCANNTSDSDGNICVSDEITFNSGPKPTGPVISYSDLPLSARLTDNQYFQYRAYLEAEENTACDGSPCLPELTSVRLNSNGETRYSGSVQEITSNNFISYKTITSASLTADDCASFQLSPDGSNYYYWATNSWVLATLSSQRSTKTEVQNYIANFSTQMGPGKLYIKAFLETNSAKTQACSIESIDLKYSE